MDHLEKFIFQRVNLRLQQRGVGVPHFERCAFQQQNQQALPMAQPGLADPNFAFSYLGLQLQDFYIGWQGRWFGHPTLEQPGACQPTSHAKPEAANQNALQPLLHGFRASTNKTSPARVPSTEKRARTLSAPSASDNFISNRSISVGNIGRKNFALQTSRTTSECARVH